jgi:hypothetical protein
LDGGYAFRAALVFAELSQAKRSGWRFQKIHGIQVVLTGAEVAVFVGSSFSYHIGWHVYVSSVVGFWGLAIGVFVPALLIFGGLTQLADGLHSGQRHQAHNGIDGLVTGIIGAAVLPIVGGVVGFVLGGTLATLCYYVLGFSLRSFIASCQFNIWIYFGLPLSVAGTFNNIHQEFSKTDAQLEEEKQIEDFAINQNKELAAFLQNVKKLD